MSDDPRRPEPAADHAAGPTRLGPVDLVIRGGLVAGAGGPVRSLDIAVSGERILAVVEPGTPLDARRELRAEGRLVTPGGVEAHAHIHEPMHRGWSGGAEVWLQRPEGATRAAIFGGTTTVLSFAFLAVHVVSEVFDAQAAVEERRGIFEGSSFADFAFHPVLTGTPDPRTIDGLARAVEAGTPTLKVFTTDVTSAQHGIRMDNGSIRALMARFAGLGGLTMVHAEDDDLIRYGEARLKALGQERLRNVDQVHTNLGEELAFRSVVRIAQDAGSAVYFVHTTGRGGIGVLAEARAAGLPVYGETLHNILCFNVQDYEKPDGNRFHIGMGLRSRDDNAALWEALADGRISTLATDEYTTSHAVKVLGETVETAAGGHVGIETRGLIGLSEGVHGGRLTLERWVDVFATNPARLMGLYPRKGVIAPGSDADLVIWNTDEERTISMADLHHDGDYSPWEGWPVRGWPETTLLRGRVVVDRGRLVDEEPKGAWVARSIDPAILRGPAL